MSNQLKLKNKLLKRLIVPAIVSLSFVGIVQPRADAGAFDFIGDWAKSQLDYYASDVFDGVIQGLTGEETLGEWVSTGISDLMGRDKIDSDTGNLIAENAGEFGLPDMGQVATDTAAIPVPETFGVNDATARVNQIESNDRTIVETAADGAFSQQGQQLSKATVESAQNASKMGGNLARQGQKIRVTQDLMKLTLAGQSAQTALLARQVAVQEKAAVDRAMQLKMLSNLDKKLERISKQEGDGGAEFVTGISSSLQSNKLF
jgi:hypothetical protein